jgi:lipoprotein-releasing system permease protein
MRKPVALFVGLRYLRARKGSGFVSFVTFASVIGVALGVATLIVVLSVMNGFEKELRERLLGLTAHASIQQEGGLDAWPPLVEQLLEQSEITGAAPYIEQEAILSGPGGLAGALITGIEPELEEKVSKVNDSMLIGSLTDLQPESYRIVLGRVLAQRAGVAVGDKLKVLVPRFPSAKSGGMGPQLVSFSVSGVFELGVQDHDSLRAFVHLSDASELSQMGAKVSGIRVETTDIFAAPAVVRKRLQEIGDRGVLEVWDWTQQNASYFRAIRIEKMMMALLLSLIIGVAAFNIVATLVMVVAEKRSGIAILRTLGCSRRDVIAIFVLQGTLIGWLGAVVGVVLGVLLSLNMDTVAPALENLLGFQFMPADLYYLTSLPVDLHTADVAWTTVVVLVVTSLATIYPALRAATVQPAEVLRYE